MATTLSRVVTAAILGGTALGVGYFISVKTERPTVGQQFHTFAMFRDGSRLPVGSQVVIAGVRVGEIESLAIDGELARIGMRLTNNVVLFHDAYAMKKSSTLLGDNYIELAPGGPDDSVTNGQPYPRLKSGDPIRHVVEGDSTERTLRAIDTALPRAASGLKVADRFVFDARAWSTGPMAASLASTEAWLDRRTVSSSLRTANRAVAGLDRATERIAAMTDGLADKVDSSLDNLDRGVASARRSMANTNASLTDGLGRARTSLDSVDGWIATASDVVGGYAGRDPVGKRGSLSTLINGNELGLQLDEAADGGAAFSRGLDKLKSYVGFRTEFGLKNGTRFYVIADLEARGDTFFRFEASKGADGALPDVSLTNNGASGFLQRIEVKEGLRFSAQWAKRFGPGTVRLGIKDSSFGVGGDLQIGGRLTLQADLFDSTYATTPNLKFSAALELFRSVFVLAGIDDSLNAPLYLPITPWPDGQGVPTYFGEVRTGRDLFAGVMLKFDDVDLTKLLMLYGGLLAGFI